MRNGGFPCEIHVPISPTPAFFNQVRLLAASFRRFGGPLRNSRIVVTVGGEEPHTDLASQLPWSRDYGVEWRWLAPELFARQSRLSANERASVSMNDS